VKLAAFAAGINRRRKVCEESFAIGANVGKEQIAERDCGDARQLASHALERGE
jgi:hypothetical protein